MSDNKKLCFKCRKEQGFVGRDNGAHTAMKSNCEGCGDFVAILPSRHWVKKEVTSN